MKVQSNTVAMWRKRFLEGGIKALGDRARSGKPPTYVTSELCERIRKQLELPPPSGPSNWDGATLAEALGVSDDAIWRILRKEGIQLRRMRSWCVSTAPEFAARTADVIGLYLGPPTNAVVLSVDEKPSIQAFDRKTGYVQTSSGNIVRGIKSIYKRHGTINLFAAHNVATDAIHAKVTAVKKRADFQAFLDDVVADVPATSLYTPLSRNIRLNLPRASAAMDTVTEVRLAIAIAQEGGIGIVHKDLTAQQQAAKVARVKRYESGVLRDPVIITPAHSVPQVMVMQEQMGISGFPVCDCGKVVGIVAGRDLRFETRCDIPVSQIMTPREKLITLSDKNNTTPAQAMALLNKHKLQRILVINDAFELTGLITVKGIAKQTRFPSAARDASGHLRMGAAAGYTLNVGHLMILAMVPMKPQL